MFFGNRVFNEKAQADSNVYSERHYYGVFFLSGLIPALLLTTLTLKELRVKTRTVKTGARKQCSLYYDIKIICFRSVTY